MATGQSRSRVVAPTKCASWATGELVPPGQARMVDTLVRLRGSRLLIHPLCECELLFVQPGLDELDWGEPAMCAVGPVHVVVDPPVLEEDLGLEQGVEALAVEVLVA